ncbi:hypothetical protein [Micromonospora sp. NPDC005174]|uniref:hypothetical protein n=1 Tax=Micromonospora sp. NPDC005174 TaxID=3157018 RepID=UPI0033B2B8C2
MSATSLTHAAGTARPAFSGGWVVDMGDQFPTWTPTRERAYDVLDARAAAKTTRILPSGEVPTPGLAVPTANGAREVVTAPTVPAGDDFHSP